MVRTVPKASKRRLLQLGCSTLALSATWPFRRASASLTVVKEDSSCRFCNKCSVMFSSAAEYSSCAAGGKHTVQGYQFRLPYDGLETPKTQGNWFFCSNCRAMFYNGYPRKGRCAANSGNTTDRGHVADRTVVYVLPHDVRWTASAQTNWRF